MGGSSCGWSAHRSCRVASRGRGWKWGYECGGVELAIPSVASRSLHRYVGSVRRIFRFKTR